MSDKVAAILWALGKSLGLAMFVDFWVLMFMRWAVGPFPRVNGKVRLPLPITMISYLTLWIVFEWLWHHWMPEL